MAEFSGGCCDGGSGRKKESFSNCCHSDSNDSEKYHLDENHEHGCCPNYHSNDVKIPDGRRVEWTTKCDETKVADAHDDEGALCLAVVGANGTDISLIDASGNVRGFSYKGAIDKLCFSSHGQDADDLLTPCFDEDGNHGIPDESCFCGVETPHLHAHVHNPKTCSDGKAKATEDPDLMKLAKLTLFPTDDQEDDFVPDQDRKLLQIPESEHMPKACNAKDLSRHISDAGTDRSDASLQNRRIHKVKVRLPIPSLILDIAENCTPDHVSCCCP